MTATAQTAKKYKTPLHELHEILADDMNSVNGLIMKHMQSPVSLIPRIAEYLIASGGKRVRPLLAMACARLCGYGGDAHIKLAAAIEFIHTATLLHDDVVDESDMRRGKPSANDVYGNQASVLVGDFLFSRSFCLMVEAGSMPVLNTLANASAVIAEGEVRQMLTQGNLDTTLDEYMRVIEGKTAALFSAATSVGAMIADADEKTVKALNDYGHNLGIAFQIADDVLDYTADEKEFGKSIGDDFREGKMTLPVLLAYQKGSPEEKQFWHRTMVEQIQTEHDLTRALEFIKAHNTMNESLNVAREYGEKAKQCLSGMKDCNITRCMIETVDFTVNRVS